MSVINSSRKATPLKRPHFVMTMEWMLAAPRTPDWFSKTPRIVVREVTAKGKIYATLINDEMVFSNSVDGVRSKVGDINELKILLAILNSKLASYYHLKNSANSQKDSFPKVLLQDLREFPFPKINKKLQKQIVDSVNTALNAKLEKEVDDIKNSIDLLIYEAYNLNNEEIEIIEGSK